MANRQKQKGDRVEREIVDLHKEMGIDAQRVPLSGSAGGSFKGDVKIGNIIAEVKSRKNGTGFSMLERWLSDNQFLFLKRDRQLPMVVMSWEMYKKMMCDLGIDWSKEFIYTNFKHLGK